jgi:uncharacterized protein YhdP
MQAILRRYKIQAKGQLAPINLKPWLADLTQSMRGQTQYSTLLTIPMTNDPVHIVLDSNLLGWQIDLPEPFKKVATNLCQYIMKWNYNHLINKQVIWL